MKEFLTSRFQTIKDFSATQQFPTTGWENLLSWDYWVESGLPSDSPHTLFSLAAVAFLVVFLLIWRLRLKRSHQTTPVYEFEIQQLISVVIFVVIISLSYWFFRSQQIAHVSSRLVLLVSGVITLGWLIVILAHLKWGASKMRTNYLEKERFFRYLPKKRK